MAEAKKQGDPSARVRGVAREGHADYENENRKHEGNQGVRYVVRYEEPPKKGTDRVKTIHEHDGLFASKAEAHDAAEKIEAKKKDGKPRYTNVNVVTVELPDRILTWDKWDEVRMKVRRWTSSRSAIEPCCSCITHPDG